MKKNIWLMPTQEESSLHLWHDGEKLIPAICEIEFSNTRNTQFIYITDYSEPKYKCYYILVISNNKVTVGQRLDVYESDYSFCKNIIATNNPDLKNVQQLTEEQLQEYCSNPVDSVEFVKIPLLSNNGRALFEYNYSISFLSFSAKIDGNSPETLAESFVRNHKDFETEGFSDYHNGLFNGFIEGYNSPKKEIKTDKLYTEDDLKTAFTVGVNVGYNDEDRPYLTFEKWLTTIKTK